MDKPSDRTEITQDNVMRPVFEQLPAVDQEVINKIVADVTERMKQSCCSNFTIDRHNNVVKEKELDVTTLSTAPTVSITPLAALTMNDVEKVIDSKFDSKFDELHALLSDKMDCLSGKAIDPVFPSYDTAAKVVSLSVSAESRSS